MAAVAAAKLGDALAPRDEANAMAGRDTDERVADSRTRSWPRRSLAANRGWPGSLEKRMAAPARELDESVARRDAVDAVAEEAAGVVNALREPLAVRVLRSLLDDERVAAPLADRLGVAVADREPNVAVNREEAGERMRDAGLGAVLAKDLFATADARARAAPSLEDAVIDVVADERAPQAPHGGKARVVEIRAESGVGAHERSSNDVAARIGNRRATRATDGKCASAKYFGRLSTSPAPPQRADTWSAPLDRSGPLQSHPPADSPGWSTLSDAMWLDVGGNHILADGSTEYFWSGPGALSVKSFRNGSALYDVGAGRFAVDEARYLLLNHEQPYAITVDALSRVESFVVFFAPGFVEGARRARSASLERLLDDPEPPLSPVRVFERTYPHDDAVTPPLRALELAVSAGERDPARLGELLHALASGLVEAHDAATREASAIPAVRASTREELYRRLWRARDYAAASFERPVGLAELARVACLSESHFLRAYRAAFGRTPHDELTAFRIERARDLLETTDMPVTDVCFAVGFESLGSFSTLFRRRTGLAPSDVRRKR
jgi:AraC-like DNA-binding protein